MGTSWSRSTPGSPPTRKRRKLTCLRLSPSLDSTPRRRVGRWPRVRDPTTPIDDLQRWRASSSPCPPWSSLSPWRPSAGCIRSAVPICLASVAASHRWKRFAAVDAPARGQRADRALQQVHDEHRRSSGERLARRDGAHALRVCQLSSRKPHPQPDIGRVRTHRHAGPGQPPTRRGRPPRDFTLAGIVSTGPVPIQVFLPKPTIRGAVHCQP